MRDITQERIVYKPFEYPEAHEYWDRDWETKS